MELLISATPEPPPETGGVLGERNGIVLEFCLDDAEARTDRCAYVPNVDHLHRVIDLWTKKEIRFAGMFHSHPYPQTGLSVADKEYIRKIMEAMPDSVSELYFPVIVPGIGMTGHLAKREDGDVIIIPEEIIIVKE